MAIIVEDTRQKDGKHQLKHIGFDSLGVDLLRCKLPFGDCAKCKTLVEYTEQDWEDKGEKGWKQFCKVCGMT